MSSNYRFFLVTGERLLRVESLDLIQTIFLTPACKLCFNSLLVYFSYLHFPVIVILNIKNYRGVVAMGLIIFCTIKYAHFIRYTMCGIGSY